VVKVPGSAERLEMGIASGENGEGALSRLAMSFGVRPQCQLLATQCLAGRLAPGCEGGSPAHIEFLPAMIDFFDVLHDG
jgi:hypothetical protein